MKPKHYIRNRSWADRRFFLKIPFRTNSAEVLPPNITVRTTGDISRSRWFVEVEYYVKAKRGYVRLDAWVRRKELLNAALAAEITADAKNFPKARRSVKKAIRLINNFSTEERSF